MSMGYDIPPPSRSPFESRKRSGSMTASYERPSNTLNRQRTPSPGPSRRGYDSYVPHRAENVPYRNVYRPNIYRPDSSSYHPRSPSPDVRSPDSASYRGSSWRPPDRRLLPPSPTSRRFEPSDSWRHGHGDRSGREYVSHPDRHFRGRASMDLSPERSPRYERLPIGVSDRHGTPYLKRDTWPTERRPLMDSYRPHYDDERPPLTRKVHPLSPTNFHGKRESESSLPTRLTDPDSGRVPMRPSLSTTALASPTPISEPSWSSPLDALKSSSLPRSASRSSIASTHVSERRSPGVASIPQPLSIRLPASLPAKPQAAIDALAKDIRRVDQGGVKPVHNGVISQIQMHAIEPEKVLQTAFPVKELADNISQGELAASQVQTHASGDEGGPSTTLPAVIDGEAQQDIDDQQIPPEPHFSPKPLTAVTESNRSPILRDISPLSSVVGSEHSKSGSPLDRTPTVKDGGMSVLEIPPTTHSPNRSPDPLKETETSRVDLLAHTTLPRPEDVPLLLSAGTMREALRITVMTRLFRDHQSREARINPVLTANLAIAPPLEVHPTSTPGSLMDKMCTGLAHNTRLEAASKTRPLLVKYFANRRAHIDEKRTKLREEYIALQDCWIAHCNALNEQQRTIVSEQENQPPVRTTRRSIATTDAVRSDFEMAQILASLGNDDATDPNYLSIRNLARIPDMISSVNGKVDTVFDDMNYLVENPAQYYAPDTGITDWTDEEKRIFMEKFGAHPKQFGVIAEFLPSKTAAQCVAYYYLHKKMFIDFRRVISQYAPNKRRRRGMGRKKGNGLLADIAMHDMEVHRGSSAPSPSTSMSAPRPQRGRRSLNVISAAKPPLPSRRIPVRMEETPTTTPTPEPEVKSRKRRVTSGTSTPILSNAPPMPIPLLASTPLRLSTPSVTEHHSFSTQAFFQATSLDTPAVGEEDVLGQESRPVKRARRTRKIKSAVIVVDEPSSPPLQTVLLPANEMADSGAGRKERTSTVQWSEDDKKRFLSLFSQYGTDFKQIAALIPPKTIGQVTSYYKTHQNILNPVEQSASTPLPPDNQEPHWSTFPASETKQKPPSLPLSAPATLMTRIKPLPMSSLGGYDSARNVYPPPASSVVSYTNQSNGSGDISPPWNAPAASHPLIHSVSPNGHNIRTPSLPETRRNPFNPPLHGANGPDEYLFAPRNPQPASNQRYTSPPEKYPENHPLPLPSRQSLSKTHLASPPNLTLRSPQDYRHPRPRIASSPPHPPSTSGSGFPSASPSLPVPAATPSIIHSPVLPAPMPMHQSPPPYSSYPHPSITRRNDPMSSVNAREHTPQYLQGRHPQFQSHSRQNSGSSMTGWTQPNSPHALDRHYHPVTSVSYEDRRRTSMPSVTAVDGKSDDGRRRETYFPTSNDNYQYPGHGWHSLPTSAPQTNRSTWASDPYPPWSG